MSADPADDARCGVLNLLQTLKQVGWGTVEKRVPKVHSAGNKAVDDGSQSILIQVAPDLVDVCDLHVTRPRDGVDVGFHRCIGAHLYAQISHWLQPRLNRLIANDERPPLVDVTSNGVRCNQ